MKIEQLTHECGQTLENALNSNLLGIMQDNSDEIRDAYPEGSFRQLFWEEQLCAATVKNACQIKWHPIMIQWCLNLKLLSSSAYHAMRTSGIMQLRSECTLRDYTNIFKIRLDSNMKLMPYWPLSRRSKSCQKTGNTAALT